MYIRIFSYIYITGDTEWQPLGLPSPETVTQSRYAKYYHEVVKPDEQRLKQERERIRTYCKEKYQNDEVYKQYKREQALKNYYKKKNATASLQTV